MSYADIWSLTPLERDIIVDELNEIFDERNGKKKGNGPPESSMASS